MQNTALNGRIGSLKLLNVSVDSVAPRLLHGDIVMIDTFQRTVSPPGIFALHAGLSLVFKQIEPTPKTVPVNLRIFPKTPPVAPLTSQLKRCILLAAWHGLPTLFMHVAMARHVD